MKLETKEDFRQWMDKVLSPLKPYTVKAAPDSTWETAA